MRPSGLVRPNKILNLKEHGSHLGSHLVSINLCVSFTKRRKNLAQVPPLEWILFHSSSPGVTSQSTERSNAEEPRPVGVSAWIT